MLALAIALPVAIGCGETGTGHRAPVMFVDVAREAGVTFRHTSGRSGRFYLPETAGAGCAFLDYDRDGRLDLFFVNSAALPGFAGKGPFYPALYRNQGDGRFTDVTRAAGLAVERYGMGCCAGDYDNDGDLDLYLTAMGPNVLFRNNGDGTFTDVTRAAGVGDPRWSTSAAWLDYDRDGRLDLFVCNYCVWGPSFNIATTDEAGRKHLADPNYYAGAPSTLYHNDGAGSGGGPVRFTDVTRRARVFDAEGKALGVAVWDEDGDGWPEIVVARDTRPNLFYRNNRDGTFTETSDASGIATSVTGEARAGMGIDTGDYDRRGHDAVAIGNFSEEALALYRNDGAGHFTDVADVAGLREASYRFLTFGLLFTDYDLDGRLDLLAANGHIDENAATLNSSVTFAERMLLFHNQGPPRQGSAAVASNPAAPSPATSGAWFLEVGESLGPGLAPARVARGLAAGDYDGDGDPDYLVNVNNGPAVLLRNDGGNANHWLTVRTIGTKSNRDGIGTKVVLEAGDGRQQGWVRSGSSYCSQSDLAVTFGLGRARRARTVRLLWPSGTVDELHDVPADQAIVVREGSGIVR
jgi:enediyne biosynthesis protein E4